MPDSRLSFLFQRYASQTCTEEEKQEFLELIDEAAHEEELKILMDKLWEGVPEGNALSSSDQEKIVNDIFSSQEKNVPIEKKNNKWVWAASLAAAMLIGILFGGALYLYTPQSLSKPATVSKAKPTDEHQFIKLPDNSTVVLNAGSTLNYPEFFVGKTREVTLIGEGYFDIKHDASRPFIVHTGKLKTTVLGTAFNIKAYAREKNITVTVLRGKVKVEEGKQLFGVVVPNQEIIYNTEDLGAKQHTVDSHHTISWMENDVFFDEITMGEACKDLEGRFGVKILFANNKVKECRFTVTFVKGESLDQILNVICEFNQAHYIYDSKKRIVISGEGC